MEPLTYIEGFVILLGFTVAFLGALIIGAHIAETVWPSIKRRIKK